MERLLQNISLIFIIAIGLISCGLKNSDKMDIEKLEQQVVDSYREFAKKADELESKAFGNLDYQNGGFIADFDKLFEQYAFGKKNRTISGLNFRNPPRYSAINTSKNTIIEQLSKTRYQITFETEPKWQSIRFLVDKKLGAWKLIRFETYVCIANHGKQKGEEIWAQHKQ